MTRAIVDIVFEQPALNSMLLENVGQATQTTLSSDLPKPLKLYPSFFPFTFHTLT